MRYALTLFLWILGTCSASGCCYISTVVADSERCQFGLSIFTLACIAFAFFVYFEEKLGI